MKLKGPLLALLILRANCANSEEQENPFPFPRKLIQNVYEDQVAGIGNFVKISNVTPENAFKRVQTLIHRLQKLQHKLLHGLYMTKDYIAFHRMRSLQSRKLIRSNTQNPFSSNFEPQKEISQAPETKKEQKKEEEKKTEEIKEEDKTVERLLVKEKLRNAKMRELLQLREAEGKDEGVDQPLLHSYGSIEPHEEGFGALVSPQTSNQELAGNASSFDLTKMPVFEPARK